MRRVYFAAIHKDPKSDYTALFPGVPGCITAADSLEDLDAMAREAIQGHLDVSRDYGDPIPVPLDLATVKAHKDAKGAEFFIAVTVHVEGGKAARLNITMPEDLVDEVEAKLEAEPQHHLLKVVNTCSSSEIPNTLKSPPVVIPMLSDVNTKIPCYLSSSTWLGWHSCSIRHKRTIARPPNLWPPY